MDKDTNGGPAVHKQLLFSMAMPKLHLVMLLSCVILGLGAVFTIIAFTTPYWLVSAEPFSKSPASQFQRLGLWEVCFNGFHEFNFRYEREFYGCKWIFDEDYNFIHDFLSPPFFKAVQTLYTLGFVALLMTCLLLMVFLLCLTLDKEMVILYVLAGISGASGVFSLIAVITFGALGDERNWMPDPDNNYLSWSFGCAVIGTLCEIGSAVLFYVEAQLAKQRNKKRSQQVFTLNQVAKA